MFLFHSFPFSILPSVQETFLLVALVLAVVVTVVFFLVFLILVVLPVVPSSGLWNLISFHKSESYWEKDTVVLVFFAEVCESL